MRVPPPPLPVLVLVVAGTLAITCAHLNVSWLLRLPMFFSFGWIFGHVSKRWYK